MYGTTGGLDVVPVDDAAVVLAGKAVGAYIDMERKVGARLIQAGVSFW